MISSISPILIVMGMMFFLEIPLDMSTMLLGTIVIGLVVDDTIYIFSMRLKRACRKKDHFLFPETHRSTVSQPVFLYSLSH